MTERYQLIADAVMAAGGEIVGRVRLQKIFYLLQQSGLGSDFRFSYHHYGPYSGELDEALDAAKVFTPVREKIRRRVSDGAPFSAFVLDENDLSATKSYIGALPLAAAQDLIFSMKEASSTVIELAATIHWLVSKEKINDWRGELIRRKGVKTEGGRIDQALLLLEKINLATVTA